MDLSGVSGYISYDASSVVLAQALAAVIAVGGFFIILYIFISAIAGKTKSKEYRELLSDMYVVGMIKKFAAEDQVDLLKELKEFARIEKKSKLKYKYIDEAIEDELKEKIAKITDEKIEKEKK